MIPRRPPARRAPGKHVLALDRGRAVPGGADHRRLDGVRELAHVARPLRFCERAQRARARARARAGRAARQPPRRSARASSGMSSRRSRERRHAHRQHLQAVEEVLAETPCLAPRPRGRCWSRRSRARRPCAAPCAEREVLLRLQQLEQLRLRRERELADLVEEQRAVLGRGHLARDAARRGRVRARDGAEQLALDQRLGQRGAVELDERLVGAAGRCRGSRARSGSCRCRIRR